uniref:Uncharacterized protein n=1 Tax=Fervidobacterium pennivorans TaxID=93466 RepID=A0A7V4KBP9_FERPE
MRKVILSIIIGILMFVVGLYGLHLEIVSPKEGEEFTTQIPVELKIDAEPGEVKKLRFYINNKLVLETEEIRERYILDISPLDYSGEVQLSIIAQAQREMMRVEADILIKNPVWLKTFGGAENDWANAVLQTQDGGYLIVGATNSFGAGREDVYILKLDKNGNKQWEKTFGGESDDWANEILQTQDGGYLIVGGTESFGAGRSDVYVLKLDKKVKKQWERTFGGESDDEANAVIQTEDGGFLIVGATGSFEECRYDVYVLKIDKNGNKQWEKTFAGGRLDDSANSILQTEDEGYVIVGASGGNVYVLKIDKNGNEQWEKKFGGGRDEATAVLRTHDEGYLIVGKTYSFGAGRSDVYIIFLDKDGNVKRMK